MSDAVPLLLAAGALASKHPWSKTPLGGVLFMPGSFSRAWLLTEPGHKK